MEESPDVKIPLGKYPQQPGLKILGVLMDLKLQLFPKDFYKFSQISWTDLLFKESTQFLCCVIPSRDTCSQAFPGGPCEMQIGLTTDAPLQGKQVIHRQLQGIFPGVVMWCSRQPADSL